MTGSDVFVAALDGLDVSDARAVGDLVADGKTCVIVGVASDLVGADAGAWVGCAIGISMERGADVAGAGRAERVMM